MFATGPIAFHTILSLIAIVAGACLILAMSKGRSPGYWTLAFLVSMIATDVTGFLHALAPNAPDNPEPPFLIAQVIVLAIFVWLIWKSVKNFRADA
jgi:hypothetical protein